MPKKKRISKKQKRVDRVLTNTHFASVLAVAKLADIQDYFNTGWTSKK